MAHVQPRSVAGPGRLHDPRHADVAFRGVVDYAPVPLGVSDFYPIFDLFNRRHLAIGPSYPIRNP